MDSIPTIQQPENLDVNLFVHQLASVYAMEKLEGDKYIQEGENKIYTDIGINADLTGYGKTISMVALVLRDRMKWDLDTEYIFENVYTYASQHVKKVLVEKYPKNNVTLVLAGSSTIHQWAAEFAHSNLNFVTVTTKKAVNCIQVDDYDVVIVAPTMCNLLLDRYNGIVWKRFIYDEPTTMRVPSMRPIRAGFTWLVTATPADIYPRHKTLRKNYISSIVGDRLFEYNIRRSVTIKNDDDFVKASFSMPPTVTINHECHDKVYRAVKGIVSERVCKMIEAGHILGAVQALGGKKTDNIVELVKKNKIIELEEICSKVKIWGLRGDEEKKIEWSKRETSVRQQIEDLDKRFADILKSNCSICYDQLVKPIMEPCCQNIFCGTCLLMWLKEKGSCPLCRRIVQKDELVYIDTKEELAQEIEPEKIKTKEDTIVEIIQENPDGYFIIFSDWNDSFESIRGILTGANIPFIEINGSTEIRRKKLAKFHDGNIKVVFLNSKTDSSGINMQETTDIILYHTMDESTRQQILGRANRIGRKLSLRIHNLLSV